MATEKWIAGSGVGLTWTSCFGTEVNSLASGNAVLSSVAISNASPLDLLCDISISLGSVTSGSAIPFIGFYLYLLNQDGSTYGDGRFGSSAAGPPQTQYYVGSVPVQASTTAAIVGHVRGIWLPPGSAKFVIYNNAGVNLASSSNTVAYRTYNRQVA